MRRLPPVCSYITERSGRLAGGGAVGPLLVSDATKTVIPTEALVAYKQ